MQVCGELGLWFRPETFWGAHLGLGLAAHQLLEAALTCLAHSNVRAIGENGEIALHNLGHDDCLGRVYFFFFLLFGHDARCTMDRILYITGMFHHGVRVFYI